ncbi:MAG: PadR family transcriptional regulator [Chloroflexi bacterium]|nr:PadR family transcriptional regulator [Chloroflexota bacterium]MCI0647328.1 PadR family transcriptional regulator [Chloroflexota bacterium]MCI0725787.1 PadR family transcriptional regulator [Chloroflexota bacterium]
MSVRHALLGLLAQRPRHGYELHDAFEAVVGGEQNWDVKPAQVYTTLARLEESGLVQQEAVAQDGGPEKRIYAVTHTGRQELEEWFLSGIERGHQRDEFFLKLMLSLVSGQADPYRVIQKQRATLYQDLHPLTVQRSQADPKTGLAQIFLLDKAIMHLEADLRWLDLIEARLDDIRRQPLPEPQVKPRGRPRKGF